MILIAGDSWGCGEWAAGFPPGLARRFHGVVPKVPFAITHRGLQQFLQEDGHQVVNICQAGGSNALTLQELNLYLDSAVNPRPQRVLVFQTEYDRDLLLLDETLFVGFPENNIQDLSQRMISQFYQALAQVSRRFQVSIDIIGGCADTLPADQVSDRYPGCRVICQSMTNLMISDDHHIARPVLSWYKQTASRELVRHMKSRCTSDQDLESLVQDLDAGMQREITLFQSPQWFYPNDVHPNRYAHHKLYRFITQGL